MDGLGKQAVFKNNTPGKDWLISFKRRHSRDLTLRKPEILTKCRAENLTVETLSEFFAVVRDVYEENDILDDPNANRRIFNTDETGFNTNPNQRKDAYLQTPNCGKQMYTVLVAGNAAGEYLKPLVVYKAMDLNEHLTTNGPHGTQYAVSLSGWMSDIIFEQWFRNAFVPFTVNKPKPVVLFFDGHGSHVFPRHTTRLV